MKPEPVRNRGSRQFEPIKQAYVEHFRARLAAYGEDVRALWNSAGSQAARFEILAAVGDLSGKAILDVGCGFGDLLTFLRSRGVAPVLYHGIDLSAEMIAAAKRRHADGVFEERDLDERPFADGSFDYVFGSGLFFLPHRLWETYVERYVRRMYSCCRVAVAVNFLSAYSTAKDGESQYAWPHEVLRNLQQALTSRVVLRHDYRPNDFTVYLYR